MYKDLVVLLHACCEFHVELVNLHSLNIHKCECSTRVYHSFAGCVDRGSYIAIVKENF